MLISSIVNQALATNLRVNHPAQKLQVWKMDSTIFTGETITVVYKDKDGTETPICTSHPILELVSFAGFGHGNCSVIDGKYVFSLELSNGAIMLKGGEILVSFGSLNNAITYELHEIESTVSTNAICKYVRYNLLAADLSKTTPCEKAVLLVIKNSPLTYLTTIGRNGVQSKKTVAELRAEAQYNNNYAWRGIADVESTNQDLAIVGNYFLINVENVNSFIVESDGSAAVPYTLLSFQVIQ
jgi:hypothetical protein